jgi:hypothetical protein
MTDEAVNLKGRSVWRHVLGAALGLVISLAMLAVLWFYKGIRVDALRQAWDQADKMILLVTIVLSAAFHHFLGAHKQWCVLRAMGVDIPYVEALFLRLGSGPLRNLVPLEAGELVNIVYFWRHKQMRFGRASGAMIFDRGLNIIGTSFWLLVGLIALADVGREWQALLLIGAGAAYGVFFFFTPLHDLVVRMAGRLVPKAGRFFEGVLAPFREFSVRQKFFFMAYGAFFQLRSLAVCYCLFRAYGVAPTLAHTVGYVPMAVLAGHMPGVVMGAGPREAAIMFLFADYASAEVLGSVGALMTLSVHAIPIFLGIPWVWWVLKRLAKKETPGPAPVAGTPQA